MRLSIKNLHSRIAESQKNILNGIDLSIEQGTVHALMGPNGSGKSTLGNTIMGHPAYEVTAGQVLLHKTNLLDLDPSQRAQQGIFLAFQHPLTIPGVPLANFLKAANDQLYGQEVANAQGVLQKKADIPALEFFNKLKHYAKLLNLDEQFLRRPINDGLSGGERKKVETLQILALQPRFIILDELDTGTDVDTLKLIGQTLHQLSTKGYGSFDTKYQVHNTKYSHPAILIITHYNRIFKYIQPSHVHIIKSGKIVTSGDFTLVEKIDQHGYEQF